MMDIIQQIHARELIPAGLSKSNLLSIENALVGLNYSERVVVTPDNLQEYLQSHFSHVNFFIGGSSISDVELLISDVKEIQASNIEVDWNLLGVLLNLVEMCALPSFSQLISQRVYGAAGQSNTLNFFNKYYLGTGSLSVLVHKMARQAKWRSEGILKFCNDPINFDLFNSEGERIFPELLCGTFLRNEEFIKVNDYDLLLRLYFNPIFYQTPFDDGKLTAKRKFNIERGIASSPLKPLLPLVLPDMGLIDTYTQTP